MNMRICVAGMMWIGGMGWGAVCLAGCPTNEVAPFAIVEARRETNGVTVVSWESCSEYLYLVQSTENLAAPTWTIRWMGVGEEASTMWADATAGEVSNRFYRVARLVKGQDEEGDGMPNEWEVAHGLNPLGNDADGDLDGDGLTNLREYQLGTNPQNSDTDGDGVGDGKEVGQGRNPNSPIDLVVFTPRER